MSRFLLSDSITANESKLILFDMRQDSEHNSIGFLVMSNTFSLVKQCHLTAFTRGYGIMASCGTASSPTSPMKGYMAFGDSSFVK